MKDPRYARVRALIDSKYITEFNQIFDNIPQAVVYADIGMGFEAFKTRFRSPVKWSIEQLQMIAKLIEIDPRILTEMIFQQSEAEAAKKPSRKK